MSDALIVGAMSLEGTLAGAWAGVRQANKLVNYRIDRLEEKVKKHNDVVERTYRLEGKMEAAFERIDEIKDKLEEL